MTDSGSNSVLSDEPILSLNNLTIGYEKPLVENVNLVVKPGDIVSIVGPSGIGKTTLIRTIANLIQPISGSIRCSVPRRGGLGYIPQKLGLVRHASVYHNVDLGARAGTPFLSEPKSWLKRRNERVLAAIDTMGISDKIREPVRKLSGGQQRRVATARTLAQCPKLILADEFLSELDEENISLVINSVKKYIDENDAAIILIEHDIKRAKEISNRMLVIDDGRLNPFVQDKVVQEVKI
ncbi:MAG: ATP-binding cassette domain-containing protein [Candidatus Thermoplasmatota archaeon]|nr:ATP-binding cassette domain-containing protein [Candidatus Thermoplasmatota archaeon]